MQTSTFPHHFLLWACLLPYLTLAIYIPPIQNFTQLVYHDGSSNVTFQQRYQMDTTNFQPGGPILLVQGTENIAGISSTQIVSFDFYDDAAALNGIPVVIEHRFFGTSFPRSFNGSPASYAPLTLENVLEDAVSLVQWIRNSIPGAETSPIFIESGSYGGFLATMARIRHPDIFYGAFSSSGALKSFGESPDNADKFRIFDWTSNIYYDLSADAANKIKSAVALLEECSQEGTCDTAIDLGLCDPQPTSQQYKELYSSILELYKRIPMYSYPFANAFQAYPILELVNLTEAANTTTDVLRAPLSIANWATADLSQCAGWASANVSTGQAASTAGSFGYILCNYLPLNQYSIGPNNMLPINNATGRVDICTNPAWAGPKSNWTNKQWIDFYSLSDEKLSQMERMVMIGGQWDSASGVALPNFPLNPDRNAPRSIMVDGQAHIADLYGQLAIPKGVDPNLDMIRNTKLEYLKEWTAIYYDEMNSSNFKPANSTKI